MPLALPQHIFVLHGLENSVEGQARLAENNDLEHLRFILTDPPPKGMDVATLSPDLGSKSTFGISASLNLRQLAGPHVWTLLLHLLHYSRI